MRNRQRDQPQDAAVKTTAPPVPQASEDTLGPTEPSTENPGTEDPSTDNFLSMLLARLKQERTREPRIPRILRPRIRLRGKRCIGVGGLGVVFEFRDSKLKRRVALKIAKFKALESPTRLQRFLKERELTAKLQHPAIPPVHQSGQLQDGRPFYVMRLIEGETLRARIKRTPLKSDTNFRTNPDFRSMLDAFLNVGAALQYAHEQRVLHRDLKPANIMLDKSDASFLVDWGLAREIDTADSTPDDADELAKMGLALTHDGQQLGSPDWMSPEQASGRHDLHSIATDIYGLGATLYHVLTGTAPHTSRSDPREALSTRLQRIASHPPPTAVEIRPDVPPELSSVCEKAMRHKPEERYSSAAELIEDIRRWQQREPVAAHRHRYSTLNHLELFASRHQRAIVVSVIALLLMITGSGWSAVQIQRSATAAEVSLAAEQEANERLFTSLEKFADTLMSDEVLASPELQDLRGRILTDLAKQYEVWSLRTDGSSRELARAAVGTIRLAQIEQQTADLNQAVLLSERAVMLAEQAWAKSPQAAAEDVIPLLDSCVAHGRISESIRPFEAAKSANRMEAVLATSSGLLSSPQMLNYQAMLAHIRVGIFYRRSGSCETLGLRHQELEIALAHAKTCVDRRHAILQLRDSQQHRLNYIAALNAQALMVHKLLRHHEAIPIYEQALQEFERLEVAGSVEASRIRIMILFNVVMSYRAAQDFEKLKQTAREGIELCENLSARFPLVLRYREDIGRGYGNLAEGLMSQFLKKSQADVLPDVLIATRKAAEAYRDIHSEYPDRLNMKSAAAVHYLRLAAYLHWADRDAEALAEFRRCLTLTSEPEQLEPGHAANALAVAIGYALIIAEEAATNPPEHAMAQCFSMALQIAEPAVVNNPAYRRLYLNDPVIQSLQQIPGVASLNQTLQKDMKQ